MERWDGEKEILGRSRIFVRSGIVSAVENVRDSGFITDRARVSWVARLSRPVWEKNL